MAKQGFKDAHFDDENDIPGGGCSFGTGFTISWQRGPLGKEGSPERLPPNGAFVEDVIDAVIARIEFYQAGKFACAENEEALINLRNAAGVLNSRTKTRKAQGVEGTLETHESPDCLK